MGDKKGIILILFVSLVSFSFASAWADNGSAIQSVDGCNLLNTTGANYVLTGNVTSTGNCFNITAQNITLDCAGKWITYSTGGAASTYGIYTNQFNSTIKNCNVLDGDWTSLESTRNAIYFDGNDNSTLLNNFVNVSKSSAIYLNSNSNYNNFTFLNVSSNSSFGIYVFLSLDNTFDNLNINSNTSNDISLYMGSVSNCNNTFNNVRGKDGKLIIYINGISSNIDNFDESMLIMCNTNFSNITNSNFTTSGISLYYSNNNNLSNILTGNNLNSALMIQSSSNNSFRDITTDNINGPGVGINLYSYSNFNIFSNIIANSKSNSGLRLYRSSNNDFSNASISSNSSRGIILEDNCNLNNFSNIDIKSNTGYGVYLISSSNNTLSNVSVSSNTSYGMFVYSSSNFNKLYNLTIISNISNVLYASLNSDSNSVVNSTLISLNNNGTLLYLGSNCNSNLFYGNNFTETSGYYVQDLNGSNYYNTTIAGRGEGNIWNDVMNGSVDIKGNISSTLDSSLYIGEYGTRYPYNNTNSFGKISGNVVDYAPLTNQLYTDTTPPYFTTIPNNAYLFYGNNSLLVKFVGTDETEFGYYSINDTRFSINQTGFLSNGTPLAVGNYEINVTINDASNNINWTKYSIQVNKSQEKCQVLFNTTSPMYNNQTFLVWGNCTSDFTLYRNGTIISNNSEQVLAVGTYNFSISRTDISNYSNNYNETQFIITLAPDTTSPTYSSVAHSSTYAGHVASFSIQVNDETALNSNGQYIFSTNNSGSWVNDTAVNFISTPSWANVTKTLNSTVGTVVSYMWYFNDSAGNMNSTSVYRLTTTQAPVVNPPSGGGGGGGSTAQVQTQYQLGREFSEQGESLKLRKNYQVGFRHQEESHTLTVNSFTTNTAKITIRSDPITATLEKDIAQSFNIDDEEGTDVEITYQGTSGSEAQFFIKKIVEVSGESEVFANSEGGEVQETNQISTSELFGTSGSGSESVDVAKEKTKRAKNPLRTVLISLIIMGAVIAGLYAIGKNEKKKKDHYLGFFDK